jgi:hypothetical protein
MTPRRRASSAIQWGLLMFGKAAIALVLLLLFAAAAALAWCR